MIVLGNLARMVGRALMKLIHLDVSAQVAGKENCVTQVSTAKHCRVKYYNFAVTVIDGWYVVNNNGVVSLFYNYSLPSILCKSIFKKIFG